MVNEKHYKEVLNIIGFDFPTTYSSLFSYLKYHVEDKDIIVKLWNKYSLGKYEPVYRLYSDIFTNVSKEAFDKYLTTKYYETGNLYLLTSQNNLKMFLMYLGKDFDVNRGWFKVRDDWTLQSSDDIDDMIDYQELAESIVNYLRKKLG